MVFALKPNLENVLEGVKNIVWLFMEIISVILWEIVYFYIHNYLMDLLVSELIFLLMRECMVCLLKLLLEAVCIILLSYFSENLGFWGDNFPTQKP